MGWRLWARSSHAPSAGAPVGGRAHHDAGPFAHGHAVPDELLIQPPQLPECPCEMRSSTVRCRETAAASGATSARRRTAPHRRKTHPVLAASRRGPLQNVDRGPGWRRVCRVEPQDVWRAEIRHDRQQSRIPELERGALLEIVTVPIVNRSGTFGVWRCEGLGSVSGVDGRGSVHPPSGAGSVLRSPRSIAARSQSVHETEQAYGPRLARSTPGASIPRSQISDPLAISLARRRPSSSPCEVDDRVCDSG
jgi:hypothetical protein